MKTSNKFLNKTKSHSENRQETAEASEFHDQRMRREMKIEIKKGSSIRPEGNDEYEQLIAEEADFDTKPMIEEAAFFIAQGRHFSPGHELSDWLQAEAEVEGLLRVGR